MPVRNLSAPVLESNEPENAQKRHISTSGKWKLIAGTVCLLLLSLIFSAALSLSSLDKLYLGYVASQYQSAGQVLQRHLRESFRVGGNIRELPGIDDILEETRAHIVKELARENHVSVSFVLADRSIAHSTDEKLVGTKLPEEIPLNEETSGNEDDSFESPYPYGDAYVLSLPVQHNGKTRESSVVIAFSEKQVRDIHDAVFGKNIRAIMIIVAFGAVFLVISNLVMLHAVHIRNFPKKKLSAVIFLIVILSQIALSALNINDFREHSLQVSTHLTEMGVAEKILSAPLQEIVLDSLTVLVISIFFVVEMLVMFSQVIDRRFENSEQRMKVHYSVIRPVFFILLFGLYISISFVPLYMERLYEPIFGLSKDVVLSLPISVFVFSTGISFLIAGIWSDLRGWHEPFFMGVLLGSTGHLCSWLSINAVHFIAAQGITGLGYGLFFMASQGFVISCTDENTKGQGLAMLFAALYAGIICGGTTGAMLAERIGFRYVFLIGAVIVFSAIAYIIFFMQNAIRRPKHSTTEDSGRSVSIKQMFQFIFNRNVITLILFSSIPANIAMVGFLNYFNPIYLDRIGVSQSNIGRIFMLYGACFIYIGPFITRYADASENKKAYITSASIIGSLAFVSFYFFEGFVASIVAILLLGVSQSFIFATQAAYMLKLKVARELGGGKAIAIYRSVNQIGQTIGPMIFGWLIVATNVNKGIIYFGLSYLLLAILFLISTQGDRKIMTTKNQTA